MRSTLYPEPSGHSTLTTLRTLYPKTLNHIHLLDCGGFISSCLELMVYKWSFTTIKEYRNIMVDINIIGSSLLCMLKQLHNFLRRFSDQILDCTITFTSYHRFSSWLDCAIVWSHLHYIVHFTVPSLWLCTHSTNVYIVQSLFPVYWTCGSVQFVAWFT